MTKDDAVPVTAEARKAAADLLNEVSSLLGDDGIGQVADLIRDGEYDEHDATLAFARFERDILARHRGSTAVVDVEALRLTDIGFLNAHALTCEEEGMRKVADAFRGIAQRIAASLSQTPATPMVQESRVIAAGFQSEVADWMLECFGSVIAADLLERADRFIEEALELAQTMPGFTADRAHALVDYVFSRPVGERRQEVGGVMVTLAALCNPVGLNIRDEAERELARVWTKVGAIRAKQAAKPTGSALPVATPIPMVQEGLREALAFAKNEIRQLGCDPDDIEAALARINRSALSATPAPPVDETDKLETHIWQRADEWVLEISGSINGTHFISRHTEPLTTPKENVAGLPSLYAALADRTQEGEVRRG